MAIRPEARAKANRRLVVRLAIATVAMFGFGYALVPLYQVFCELTGLGGKTAERAALPPQRASVDRQRWVTVEFSTGLNGGMPWEFKPLVSRLRVHPGEMHAVDFYAGNRSEHEITGQAVPSVTPAAAAKYFSKVECFCFTEQRLAAHTGRQMPVRFFIDPALPEDIGTVTLSYTFFETPTSAERRAHAAGDTRSRTAVEHSRRAQAQRKPRSEASAGAS